MISLMATDIEERTLRCGIEYESYYMRKTTHLRRTRGFGLVFEFAKEKNETIA